MRTFLLVTFIVFIAGVSCQTTPLEKLGLVALYNLTGGATWRNNWNINSDPCITGSEWYGVKCRAVGNNQYNVWSLVVQGNNLSGRLPTEIGHLTFLQFLYLSGNNLYGTIPSEIGNLQQLVQIGFDKNQLTGGIPDTFKKLAGLQIIYFQDNLFTGPIDAIATLPGIQYVWFSRNSLMGTLPEALGQIFSLQQIGIDSNNFTGTVPSGFGQRQNQFQAFWAQGNHFTGAFPTHVCVAAGCDLTGSAFNCPLPNPPCCHINSCVTPPPPQLEDKY